MRIKKGDTILVIAGNDKGRKAKVIKTSPRTGRIQAEGINIQKKHHRPRKEGEKGQIIEKPGFISVSNVKLICPKCGKPTRVGYEKSGGKKMRVCKECGQKI